VTVEERLAKVETRVQHIDETVKSIQKQVGNHIPTDIGKLRKELNDFKLQQARIFVAILTSTILTLIGVVCVLATN
jgi:uncharacterized coiled-coil protein SlyX